MNFLYVYIATLLFHYGVYIIADVESVASLYSTLTTPMWFPLVWLFDLNANFLILDVVCVVLNCIFGLVTSLPSLPQHLKLCSSILWAANVVWRLLVNIPLLSLASILFYSTGKWFQALYCIGSLVGLEMFVNVF